MNHTYDDAGYRALKLGEVTKKGDTWTDGEPIGVWGSVVTESNAVGLVIRRHQSDDPQPQETGLRWITDRVPTKDDGLWVIRHFWDSHDWCFREWDQIELGWPWCPILMPANPPKPRQTPFERWAEENHIGQAVRGIAFAAYEFGLSERESK